MAHRLSLATCRPLRRRPQWPSEPDYSALAQMDRDLIARRLRLPVLDTRATAQLLSSFTPKRKVAFSAGAGSGTADERMDGR